MNGTEFLENFAKTSGGAIYAKSVIIVTVVLKVIMQHTQAVQFILMSIIVFKQ